MVWVRIFQEWEAIFQEYEDESVRSLAMNVFRHDSDRTIAEALAFAEALEAETGAENA